MALSSIRGVLRSSSFRSFRDHPAFPFAMDMKSMSTKLPGIATYEEIKELPRNPEIYLIDVREPSEIQETGSVPTSINIPLGQIGEKLTKEYSEEQFQMLFKRKKPLFDTPMIFMCKIGRRSQKALEIAQSLGYKNGRNFLGSWDEWYQKENSTK